LLFGSLVLSACGGSGDIAAQRSTAEDPGSGRYLPKIVSSDLAIGENRFVVGIVDQEESSPVSDAQIRFRFFTLNGDQATFKSEVYATTLQLTKSYTHTHDDGTVESHEAGELGVYVADVVFDSSGTWGVEITGTVRGAALEPVTQSFEVRARTLSVAIGEAAPLSTQPILDNVNDIAEIDTSDPPLPEMHDRTIADAVTSGRPTVIVFATPAFCMSQICGPTKSVVDEIYQEYATRANFVHVEPYDIEKARNGHGLDPLPFLEEEWGLRTEPWVFLVDRNGKVAAKFEAVVSREEIVQALLRIL
jgi:hypothetical protein